MYSIILYLHVAVCLSVTHPDTGLVISYLMFVTYQYNLHISIFDPKML